MWALAWGSFAGRTGIPYEVLRAFADIAQPYNINKERFQRQWDHGGAPSAHFDQGYPSHNGLLRKNKSKPNSGLHTLPQVQMVLYGSPSSPITLFMKNKLRLCPRFLRSFQGIKKVIRATRIIIVDFSR